MLERLLQLPMSTPLLVVAVAFVGGLFPIGPVEIALIILSYRSPVSQIPMLIIVATVSCILAKTLVYCLAESVAPILPGFIKKKIVCYQDRFNTKSRLSAGVIFISAMIGLPPYFIVNIISGVMQINVIFFLTFSCLGFFIRFSLALYLPWLFQNIYYFFVGK